jgi:hypothetical protein
MTGNDTNTKGTTMNATHEQRPGIDRAIRLSDGTWYREYATSLDGRLTKVEFRVTWTRPGSFWNLEARIRIPGSDQSMLTRSVFMGGKTKGGCFAKASAYAARGFVSNGDGTVDAR